MTEHIIPETTKDKLNSLTSFFKKEDEKYKNTKSLEKQALLDYNSSSTSEKNIVLYTECLETAKKKDIDMSNGGDNNNDINATYVADIFNPETTSLDVLNLYYNLRVLKILQQFNILSYEFDIGLNKNDKSEYDMNYRFWKDKVDEDNGLSKDEKYIECLLLSFKQSFYTSFFGTVAQNSDKISYNNHKLKMKNILSFLDDDNDHDKHEDMNIHTYFLEWMTNQTKPDSIIFVTPDLTKFISIDEASIDEVTEEEQITFLGKSDGRMFYEINVNHFGKTMKGFKEGAFFLNGGKYIINPTKPLVYFNQVVNPFLTEPLLISFNNLDFSFAKDNSTYARINDLNS